MDRLTLLAIEDTKHDLCDMQPCNDCLHAQGFDTQDDLEQSLLELTFKSYLLDWARN
jgi:hypothetical protein